jgi:hypothetical protein
MYKLWTPPEKIENTPLTVGTRSVPKTLDFPASAMCRYYDFPVAVTSYILHRAQRTICDYCHSQFQNRYKYFIVLLISVSFRFCEDAATRRRCHHLHPY